MNRFESYNTSLQPASKFCVKYNSLTASPNQSYIIKHVDTQIFQGAAHEFLN
jgi:hypothetical protein